MLLGATSPPKAYLSSLPQSEAMGQLIDAFRLRCDDVYVFNLEYVGVYTQAPGEPRKAFLKYLDMAERRRVVPGWWNAEMRRRVEMLAMDEDGDHSIRHAVERNDIVKAYGGDGLAPMKLRAVAEKVYGEPVSDWLAA